MNLRRRIALLFAMLLVIVAALVVFVVVDVQRERAAQADLADVLAASVQEAHGLAASQLHFATAVNALVDTTDPTARASMAKQFQDQAVRVARLEQISSDNPDLAVFVDRLSSAAASSRSDVVEPVLDALDDGRVGEARRLASSTDARDSAAELADATRALLGHLQERQVAAQEQLMQASQSLAFALVSAVVCLVVAWLGVLALIRRSVLDPLDEVRRGLRNASRDRNAPIQTHGPSDFQSLAADAEGMRRDLVRQVDEAEAARAALIQDAPLVAQLQESLTPTLPDADWLRIRGRSRPQEGLVAGDWWDAIERPDGTIALVIGDVSGHGVGAGSTAVQVCAATRAALAAGLAAEDALRLARHALERSDHFATVIIVIVDGRASTLTWANAGHIPAVVVRDNGRIERCSPTGPLVSRLSDHWSTSTVEFNPGDVMLTFTDGLVEAGDAGGARVDDAVLEQWIAEDAAAGEAEELVERVVARARARSASFDDDLTVVCAARPRPVTTTSGKMRN